MSGQKLDQKAKFQENLVDMSSLKCCQKVCLDDIAIGAERVLKVLNSSFSGE